MAARYNLQPNEVMILKGEGVMHGGGFGSSYTDELILTNLNLVLLKKGMFGIATAHRGTVGALVPISEAMVSHPRG